MQRKSAIAASILAFAATAATATAGAPSPWNLSWPASRIAGTYQTNAEVRACGSSDPYRTVINTLSFNYGGTVLESPRSPPVGVANAFGIPGLFTRTVGLGSWSYNPRTHKFSMTLRYDFFVDGVFRGTGIVERDIDLSVDANTASGSVNVVMYNPDGSVLRKLCGSAVSTRL